MFIDSGIENLAYMLALQQLNLHVRVFLSKLFTMREIMFKSNLVNSRAGDLRVAGTSQIAKGLRECQINKMRIAFLGNAFC